MQDIDFFCTMDVHNCHRLNTCTGSYKQEILNNHVHMG